MNALLENFIHKLTKQLEPLELKSKSAWWNLATTGDQVYANHFKEANVAIKKIFSSSQDYHDLRSQNQPHDPLLKRQRDLLLLQFQENQIESDLIEKIVNLETEIEEIYTNFRPTNQNQKVNNNDILEVLSKGRDITKRQEAWESSKLIGEEVEEKILKLVQLRNLSAKQAGFSNFYSMQLAVQEIDESFLFTLLDHLENETAIYWDRYKSTLDKSLSLKFGIHVSELRPWHYQDPFFQEAPQEKVDFDVFYRDQDIVKISRQFYDEIQLSTEDILAKSDLYERENKSQHGFCICLDRKQDIRILCNLRSNEYWMGVQLHELGHAVYDKYIDSSLPFFLRTPAHTSTTEAIAMLFGRLSKNSDFLKQFAKAEVDEAIIRQSRIQIASQLLVFARWSLVMIHFERALYQNPRQNLNLLWWDYVKRFQGISPIPFRDKPDWAAKLHLACAPAYYQNYILGEMTASQLNSWLRQKTQTPVGLCYSPETGSLLKNHLFNLGAQHPWQETVLKATGENLSAYYLVQEMSQVLN